jgi:hypothetical protein
VCRVRAPSLLTFFADEEEENQMTCSRDVCKYEFHLSTLDLVVVVGELQRRIGCQISLHVDAHEGALEIHRRIPWSRRNVHDYHLRFQQDVHTRDFRVAADALHCLNLQSTARFWCPTHIGMRQSSEFDEVATWCRERLGVQHGVDDVMTLTCWRGAHYAWDAKSWTIFVELMYARREALWAEVHLWRDALAFYHLLTRKGVDRECVLLYTHRLFFTSHNRTFCTMPKRRAKRNSQGVSVVRVCS